MKTFNSIQIASLLVTSPIWLSALHDARFRGASPLFWLGCLITTALFVWSVIAFRETMGE